MSKSNWKGSERRAAKIFPGGSRRHRWTEARLLTCDDIKLAWCLEKRLGKQIVKIPRRGNKPGVYVDVKKKTTTSLVTEFDEMAGKYCCTKYKGRLVLVTHKKGDNKQLCTVDDKFFRELIWAWYEKYIGRPEKG